MSRFAELEVLGCRLGDGVLDLAELDEGLHVERHDQGPELERRQVIPSFLPVFRSPAMKLSPCGFRVPEVVFPGDFGYFTGTNITFFGRRIQGCEP